MFDGRTEREHAADQRPAELDQREDVLDGLGHPCHRTQSRLTAWRPA